MMIRTVRVLPSGTTAATLLLLGVPPAQEGGRRGRSGDDAEMLLNSRSGQIHLFPAVAPSAEVAFRNFQARGGFMVSACKDAQRVYNVEIAARRTLPCQLMNPWPGRPVVVHEVGQAEPVAVQLDQRNGECLVFAAVATHKYQVEPK